MNINEFLDFVNFLKNVDKYEQRVQVLKDENTRLEDNIRLTSEIADIPRTKELTAKLLDEARSTLASAKQEASETKEKAKTSYDKKLAEVVVRETEAAAILAEGKAAVKEAKDLQTGLIAELKKQEKALAARDAILAATQLEVDERLAKLKAVMG
jgi:chromosome segregation ATPase